MLGPRKPPRRAIAPPRCPTTAEVAAAYRTIALDYVYGLYPRRPRSMTAFRAQLLEFIELALDDEEILRYPENERLTGELEEMFLRVGGTPEELRGKGE